MPFGYQALGDVTTPFCGFPRQRSRGPTFYPVACMPQAWAAATPLYLLQSCLGLSFECVFRKPVLPR